MKFRRKERCRRKKGSKEEEKGREMECLSRREAEGSRSQTEASPSRRPEITRARVRGKFARQLFILKYARAGMHPGKCAGVARTHLFQERTRWGNERIQDRYSKKQPRVHPHSTAFFSVRRTLGVLYISSSSRDTPMKLNKVPISGQNSHATFHSIVRKMHEKRIVYVSSRNFRSGLTLYAIKKIK